MTKTEKATLPWQRVTREGYQQLDLLLDVSDANGSRVFKIRRQQPSEDNPGAFVVWHNGERISDKHHLQRPDAITEAERFFYELPEFAASNNGKMVHAAIIQGREAATKGASIYQNPFGVDNQVDRSLWVQGYLESIGATIAAKAIEAATATARVNAQIESDLHYMQAAYRLCKLAINYACNYRDTVDGIAFIREWATSNDEQGFYAKYPGWKEYRDADTKA